MNKTSIEWTDYTWNPVTGCHKVSQGCKNCYAETMTKRFGKSWGVENFRQVVCHEDRLMEPCHMGDKLQGKKVFVCDMSDLFHEDVPVAFIAEVFETIWNCPETTFQILTKRPERAVQLMTEVSDRALVELPLKNVWFGVSCEDQATADQRIPLLLKIPAAVRFLSCEPLIGPLDICQSVRVHQFRKYGSLHSTFFGDKIQWVIAGGESGHGARPMHPDWVRSLRDQCAGAQVPFFFKQWGEWIPSSNLDGDTFFAYMGHAQIFENGKPVRQPRCHYFENGQRPGTNMFKVGKSKSGNLLDGKQHLEFPIVKPAAV